MRWLTRRKRELAARITSQAKERKNEARQRVAALETAEISLDS